MMAFVLVSLLGAVLINPFGRDDAHTDANAQTAPQVKAEVTKLIPKIDYSNMNAEIPAIIAQYPGYDIGVAAVDIKTGDNVTYGVENPFVAASTAKLLTAIAYLHDVEQGKSTLSQTVGSRTAQAALEAMIVESDNGAWNDFNNGVMSHDELAAYALAVGFSNYDPNKNTITASSLAGLLSKLYQKKLLNAEHTNLLLSYMQRAKEVEYITSMVPAGVKVYHKPGYLSDRIHDAAIIDNGERPYVLVVFTKSRTKVYDSLAGADMFRKITQSTLTTFIE
jgi:beta-lactamase class A